MPPVWNRTATILCLLVASRGFCFGQDPSHLEFFESRIRPVFAEKCAACHSATAKMAGLDLMSAAGFTKGADTGALVDGNDIEHSRLVRAVQYRSNVKMPPTGKLAAEEIEAIETWVSWGAPWPEPVNAEDKPRHPGEQEAVVADADHWAFQPLNSADPPAVEKADWARSPVDRFILARLGKGDIEPAAPADRLTLLRRAKFDLHGLPPTEAEIDAFVADTEPDAFARLVDRLLDSPRYGERWGRHWLDVARYATSTGVDEDHRYPDAWRYRDYVIDAFNRDLPYDQFVREQIAGDLLPASQPGTVNINGITATGFLALGPKAIAQQDRVKMVYDVVDEQIDTVSKVFMGLTVACSRCHDHKFDPVLTTDYYSLASIFASTQTYADLSLEDGNVVQFHMEPLVPQAVYQRYRSHKDRIDAVEKRIESILELTAIDHMEKRLLSSMVDYMAAARQVYVEGKDVHEASRAADLDPATVKMWAEYLDPGDQLRLYLKDWHDADAKTVRGVAEEYRQAFAASSAEWRVKVAAWKKDVRDAYQSRKPAPKKPRTAGHENRVHEEAALKKGGPFYLDTERREATLSPELTALIGKLRAEKAELEQTSPPRPPMASAVIDGEVVDQPVFIRGSHHNHGEIVPKAFPVVLAGRNQTPVKQGSGRRELADWLVTGNAALTSRVMVNRIWLWHFGEGLVRTPNNFGKVGENPTHPALLDYLAREFIDTGWSVKQMHRLIMTSRTYQTSSRPSADALKLDPRNDLWSRFNRRRLSIEEMRDTVLALEGSLDLTMGGTLQPELGDSTKGSSSPDPPYLAPKDTKRRTVYLPLYRNRLPKLLGLFDFVDSTASTAQRSQTNVAPQGLFVMNSRFLDEGARAFAQRLLDRAADDTERIELAYRWALARAPLAEERRRMEAFVSSYPQQGEKLAAWQGLCRVLMASNEFHYVD